MSPDTSRLSVVHPDGWPAAKGYANGMIARGSALFVAGQIGCSPEGVVTSGGMAAQFALALDNVIAVVRAAGGQPADIARMTVYVTDMEAYRVARRSVGEAWRARLGKHFPAMALVGVTALVEPLAVVEIEAVAFLENP